MDPLPPHARLSVRQLLAPASRFLFLTGKGGVGKTSIACATAVSLADQGKRVLLVGTDPASNLDEVLGVQLGRNPTPVPGAPGLAALNVDPQAAAAAYRERLVGPMRGLLPDAILRSMEEQLSGACTTEIAAFDEFTQWLGDPAASAGFDHVVFDTAPTGHTLRLLALPGAWTGFLDANTSGTSCLGPLAGLQKQRARYQAALDTLRDPSRSAILLVSRPQSATLAEAERAGRELAALGVSRQSLVVNGLPPANPDDPVAHALARRTASALERHAAFLSSLPVALLPLRRHNLVGLAALRSLLDPEPDTPAASTTPATPTTSTASQAPAQAAAPSAQPRTRTSSPVHATDPGNPDLSIPAGFESLDNLVADLARVGHGVILAMGKGGVGKTTLAAAIATRLADLGFPVHLSTTDPAAHVAIAAGRGVPGLEVSRIDPAAETRAYVDHVLATTGPDLDPAARALLEEDLRSPCTEEIAVFRAFARTVAAGSDRFVVLDTAPTGHTLLLLDATEAYHREIARKASDLPEEVRQLLPRLRDPDWTRVLVVTVAEPTPVHEAAALQADLRRAGIEPCAWVVNQCLAASGTRDPLLAARAAGEIPFLHEVSDTLARRAALIPWVPDEPVGPEALRQLVTA